MRLALLAALLFTACLPRLVINPERGRQEVLRGVDALGAGKVEEAEISFELALQFDPCSGEALNGLGLVESRRGHQAKAKEHFIHAIRCDGRLAQAYNNLGKIYLDDDRDLPRAREMFDEALKINPDFSTALNNLALTYFRMGDFKKARRYYRTLVHVNPVFAMAHHDLAISELQLGNSDEAIFEFLQAVQLDPGLAIGWLGLGTVYLARDQLPKAKDAFVACIDADPTLIACHDDLRIVNARLPFEPSGRP